MSPSSPRIASIALALLVSAGVAAQPGSGTKWEMKMNMPGMEEMQDIEIPEGVQLPPGVQLPGAGGGGFMTHNMCASKDTSKPPPAKEDCKVLEQRSNGNRHYMKMQCPEGLMEMDSVRTATTMHADMKLTEKSGAVNEMTMDGRVLGDCDYAAESGAQQAQIAGVKKQIQDAQAQSDAQIRVMCDQGVREMQGYMFGTNGACAARKKEFCDRLQTIEGWSLLRKQTAQEQPGMPSGYSRADQLRMCGVAENVLLAKLCPQALSKQDFHFVDENCPARVAVLCDAAMQREELWYVAENCPALASQIAARECAGRQYTAMIGTKYQQFCAATKGGDLGATATACTAFDQDQDGQVEENEGCVPPEDNKVKAGVKKGLDGLKGIFNR